MGSKVKLTTIASIMLCFYGCEGKSTIAGPSNPIAETPNSPIVVVSPSPNTTPNTTPSFELWGSANACINILYTGESSYAEIETFYTSFDNQNLEIAKKSHSIPRNETLTRCFNIPCIQGDAEQVSVKPIGGIFFDKNMNPASSQQATESCKSITPSPSPKPTPKPTPTPCPPKKH